MNHRSRIFVLVMLIMDLSAFAPGSGPAQDVPKVSPETHQVILDNEHARVFDVHVKPGEKVAMHSHPAGRTTSVIRDLINPSGRIQNALDSTGVEARPASRSRSCSAPLSSKLTRQKSNVNRSQTIGDVHGCRVNQISIQAAQLFLCRKP